MPQLKELNDVVSLQDQMQSNEDGSIVLINVFTIDPADEEALLASWSHDAAFMKEQPGYILTQMHKAIGGSGTYINANYELNYFRTFLAVFFKNSRFQ